MIQIDPVKPCWVGRPVNEESKFPHCWPVVIEHKDGFQPAIVWHRAGFWVEEVPFRLEFSDARERAKSLAAEMFIPPRSHT